MLDNCAFLIRVYIIRRGTFQWCHCQCTDFILSFTEMLQIAEEMGRLRKSSLCCVFGEINLFFLLVCVQSPDSPTEVGFAPEALSLSVCKHAYATHFNSSITCLKLPYCSEQSLAWRDSLHWSTGRLCSFPAVKKDVIAAGEIMRAPVPWKTAWSHWLILFRAADNHAGHGCRSVLMQTRLKSMSHYQSHENLSPIKKHYFSSLSYRIQQNRKCSENSPLFCFL